MKVSMNMASLSRPSTPAAPPLRTLGLLLLVVAVVLGYMAAEAYDAAQAQAKAVASAQAQLQRTQTAVGNLAQRQALATPKPSAADVLPGVATWAELASLTQAESSEARNLAQLLTLTKKACEAAGLRDCQVTRGIAPAAVPMLAASSPASQGAASLSATANAPRVPLTEYSIKLVANVGQTNGMGLFAELDKAKRLYRVQGISVQTRRFEADVLFWLNDQGLLELPPALGKAGMGSTKP